ncbi:hypothetical protein BDP27DRAFT_1371459 [Rhodocollybia butyracea]|uniref:Uncharacterized protein n=1 Tax=Rhodocollybia butyracea TaxID=206335 RepID=A0A9P5PC93_9AGAR|nr:hypothetical protein BDP27DRAFT_1371459 [Rhodocollybia butyracea]
MFIIPARLKAIIHSGSPPVVDASQSIPPRYQLFLRNIKPLVKHIGSPGFRAAFGPEWNTLWEWLRAGLSVIRVYEHNAIVSDTLRHSVVALVWPILRVLTHIIEEISHSETSNYTTMILEARELKELLALCVVVAVVEPDPLTTDTDLYQQWVTKAVSKMSGTLENDFAEALEVASRSITGLRLIVLWKDCAEVQFMHHGRASIPGHRLYLLLRVIILPGNRVHSRLDVARSTWPYIYKLWCLLTSTRSKVIGTILDLRIYHAVSYRAQHNLNHALSRGPGLTRGNSSEEALLKVWNAAVDTFWNAESVSLRKATWRLTLVTACAKHVIVPVVKWSRTALKHAKLPIIEKHIGWNVKNWELNGKMLIAVYIEHSIYTPGGLGCTIPTLEKHYLREFIKVKITQLGPQIRTLVNNRTDMAVVVDFFTGSADTPSLSTKQEILPKLSSETRKEVGRRTGEILCCARIPLDSKTSALILDINASLLIVDISLYIKRFLTTRSDLQISEPLSSLEGSDWGIRADIKLMHVNGADIKLILIVIKSFMLDVQEESEKSEPRARQKNLPMRHRELQNESDPRDHVLRKISRRAWYFTRKLCRGRRSRQLLQSKAVTDIPTGTLSEKELNFARKGTHHASTLAAGSTGTTGTPPETHYAGPGGREYTEILTQRATLQNWNDVRNIVSNFKAASQISDSESKDTATKSRRRSTNRSTDAKTCGNGLSSLVRERAVGNTSFETHRREAELAELGGNERERLMRNELVTGGTGDRVRGMTLLPPPFKFRALEELIAMRCQRAGTVGQPATGLSRRVEFVLRNPYSSSTSTLPLYNQPHLTSLEMSEDQHRVQCFRIHGLDVDMIIECAGIFATVQNQVKCTLCRTQTDESCERPPSSLVCSFCHGRHKTCDYARMLRFCAYAHLEGISVAEAVEVLTPHGTGFTFPTELFRDALDIIERDNSSVEVLQRVDFEREAMFPASSEERKGLSSFIQRQKEEDPWQKTVDSEKSKRERKKDKTSKKGSGKQGTTNKSQPSIRFTIPALAKPRVPSSTATDDPVVPPVNDLPITQPESPLPTNLPQVITRKRSFSPTPDEASRVVRPRLGNSQSSSTNSKPVPPPALPTHPEPPNPNQPVTESSLAGPAEGLDLEGQHTGRRFFNFRKRRKVQVLGDRNQGLAADAIVERNRADVLFSRVKDVEASAALLTAEYRRSRQRTTELEAQLAERVPPTENAVNVSELQQNVRHLQAIIDGLRRDLKEANRSFNILSYQHQEVLRRSDHTAEISRRVAREISALESSLVEKKKEIRVLEDMMMSSVGTSSESLVRDLQSDREALVNERNVALEYAIMLRQLDLPGFVRRFEQRAADPLFRLNNFLRTFEDQAVLDNPLFVEIESTLSEVVPAITNAACRAQLALRTVLEDFDLQFPHVRRLLRETSSSRVVHSLLRNAGMESMVSSIEPVFDADRTIRYGEYLKSSPDFFPLYTLKDPESPALQKAIRELLADLDALPYTPTPTDSSVNYSPLPAPSFSPLSSTVPGLGTASRSDLLPPVSSQTPNSNPPREPSPMEEIEYVDLADIPGLHEEEDELEEEGEDELNEEVREVSQMAIREDVVIPGQEHSGGIIPEVHVQTESLFVPNPHNPLHMNAKSGF